MKIGLCLPQLGPHTSAAVVREFASQSEALQFDSLWVQEHLFYPQPALGYAGAPELPWPEPYAELLAPLELLSFVAGFTSRIELGTSILVTAYHRPLTLAKQAATLDVLSGGRLRLGLGLGWSEEEYALMDTPFSARGARSRDFIRALQACLGPDPVSYEGPFFSIPPCLTSPKPLAGGIPLISGFWSEAGLRRTAEHCAAWMPAGLDLQAAVGGLRAINNMAESEFQRGPLQLIYRAFCSPQLPGRIPVDAGPLQPDWHGSIDAIAERVSAAREAGVDELILDTSFYSGLTDADAWLAQPEFFAPLVELAHS